MSVDEQHHIGGIYSAVPKRSTRQKAVGVSPAICQVKGSGTFLLSAAAAAAASPLGAAP